MTYVTDDTGDAEYYYRGKMNVMDSDNHVNKRLLPLRKKLSNQVTLPGCSRKSDYLCNADRRREETCCGNIVRVDFF